MQEINALKQLRDKIIGIEMHLSLIQSDLNAVDKDIAFLQDLISVLRENIGVLKSDQIIAVASEYKKIVAELKIVDENLTHYNTIKNQLDIDMTRYMKLKTEALLEFENLKTQVDARKVILLFDPSKRKK